MQTQVNVNASVSCRHVTRNNLINLSQRPHSKAPEQHLMWDESSAKFSFAPLTVWHSSRVNWRRFVGDLLDRRDHWRSWERNCAWKNLFNCWITFPICKHWFVLVQMAKIQLMMDAKFLSASLITPTPVSLQCHPKMKPLKAPKSVW